MTVAPAVATTATADVSDRCHRTDARVVHARPRTRAAEPGAVPVGTTPIPGAPLVVFQNPDGSLGLFAQNDTPEPQTIRIDVTGASTRTIDICVGEMLTVRWTPNAR